MYLWGCNEANTGGGNSGLQSSSTHHPLEKLDCQREVGLIDSEAAGGQLSLGDLVKGRLMGKATVSTTTAGLKPFHYIHYLHLPPRIVESPHVLGSVILLSEMTQISLS